MLRIDSIVSCLEADNAKQADSHQNECISCDAIVLDELLKAILAFEDFLFILAGKYHLFAAVLTFQCVLMVQI